MDASLVMFKADGTRRDFPLRPGAIVVGRKNSCELRIPLSSVSRQHCEITIEDDTLKLRDLGSSNGTYHNSIRVQEAELEAGDEIAVGPVVFTVVVDGVPDEIKPIRTIITSGDSHGSAATVTGATASSSDEDDLAVDPEVELSEASAPTLDLADDDEEIIHDLDAMEADADKKQKKTSNTVLDESSMLDFDFDDLTDDDDD